MSYDTLRLTPVWWAKKPQTNQIARPTQTPIDVRLIAGSSNPNDSKKQEFEDIANTTALKDGILSLRKAAPRLMEKIKKA